MFVESNNEEENTNGDTNGDTSGSSAQEEGGNLLLSESEALTEGIILIVFVLLMMCL